MDQAVPIIRSFVSTKPDLQKFIPSWHDYQQSNQPIDISSTPNNYPLVLDPIISSSFTSADNLNKFKNTESNALKRKIDDIIGSQIENSAPNVLAPSKKFINPFPKVKFDLN